VRRLLIPSCLLALILGMSGHSPGAEPVAGHDPEARRLFNDVLKAYKALPAYADAGTFTIAIKIDGKLREETRPMALTFARPDKVALDAGTVRLAGDGKELATTIIPSAKYMIGKGADAIAPGLFSEGPLGAILRGGPAGPATAHLLNASMILDLLVGDDPSASLLENTKALTLGADTLLGDKPVKVLHLEQARGPALRLLVDPKTNLLNRVEMVVDPKDLEAKVPGVALSDATIAWASGPISTTDPDPKAFAFTKPATYTEVAPVEFGKKKGDDTAQVHKLVGKASPDFTLTVLDGPGKTRKVSKADLAGKVVLLDFWATWCPPCMLELPEVAKLTEGYAKARKGVIVVAISEDTDPEDLPGLRKLIDETLKAAGIDLQKGDVGKIALDPTNAVGNAFGVEGIPMVVLLDREGVVQAVHEGYRPEIAELFTTEIDSLLEGKPLFVPPKIEVEAKGEKHGKPID